MDVWLHIYHCISYFWFLAPPLKKYRYKDIVHGRANPNDCSTTKFIASNFQQINTCSLFIQQMVTRLCSVNLTKDMKAQTSQWIRAIKYNQTPAAKEFIWIQPKFSTNTQNHFKFESNNSIQCFCSVFVCNEFGHISSKYSFARFMKHFSVCILYNSAFLRLKHLIHWTIQAKITKFQLFTWKFQVETFSNGIRYQ